jgi:hypothetical protein
MVKLEGLAATGPFVVWEFISMAPSPTRSQRMLMFKVLANMAALEGVGDVFPRSHRLMARLWRPIFLASCVWDRPFRIRAVLNLSGKVLVPRFM